MGFWPWSKCGPDGPRSTASRGWEVGLIDRGRLLRIASCLMRRQAGKLQAASPGQDPPDPDTHTVGPREGFNSPAFGGGRRRAEQCRERSTRTRHGTHTCLRLQRLADAAGPTSPSSTDTDASLARASAACGDAQCALRSRLAGKAALRGKKRPKRVDRRLE